MSFASTQHPDQLKTPEQLAAERGAVPGLNAQQRQGDPAIRLGGHAGWWRTMSSPPAPPKPLRGLDSAWDVVVSRLVPMIPRTRRYMRRSARIVELETRFAEMAQADLDGEAETLRERVRRGRATAIDIEVSFAVVRELAWRAIGLRAYPVQVAAACAIDDGCIAEVATGEGKTLIATMPAVVAGWRGRGCHVITSNDYLAQRDADTMRAVYEAAGMTVGAVTGEMDPGARRAAYACDITYTTNKEGAADYLRDRLLLGEVRGLTEVMLDRLTGKGQAVSRMVQRGLEVAIVDEADAVLIDEGVTPLIISGDAPNAELTDAFGEAAQLARRFENGRDYAMNPEFREIRLTAAGRKLTAQLTENLHGLWKGLRRSEELIVQAITARDLFLMGKQYVVQDGKIVIVDESTGRLMPDRTWREGLHQAVEAKENLEVTPPKDTLARVSFQRFFRSYRKLSGMTGTAWEERAEFFSVFRCPIVRIPTHKPCVRAYPAPEYVQEADARWARVAQEVKREHEAGRPVLIGTKSVRASEALSAKLEALALPHVVLNAVRHAEEAEIVERAGQPGAITVATNMAGRGTDIGLGEGIAENGGLAVIVTELNDSRRIDRQLFGRAARQGDPGSAAVIVSLEDEIIERYTLRPVRKLLRNRAPGLLFRLAQRRSQARARNQRKGVLKRDQYLSESLGFAGVE